MLNSPFLDWGIGEIEEFGLDSIYEIYDLMDKTYDLMDEMYDLMDEIYD